jgi:hypothetical protein
MGYQTLLAVESERPGAMPLALARGALEQHATPLASRPDSFLERNSGGATDQIGVTSSADQT